MYKYRSKCRWNMLLHIDGEVVEIRPSELFESKGAVESRYLDLISKPKKVEKPSKKQVESLDVSSSAQS
jgi:hypothetical protein